MLTNAKVGTKLLALIVAPVMVLLAVASLGARDRLDDAAEASQVEDAADLTTLTDAATRTLAVERLQTSVVLTQGTADGLESARADATASIDRLDPVLSSDSVPGATADRLQQVRERLADLGDLRNSVDSGDAGLDVTMDAYDLAIDELIRLEDEVASATSAAGLSITLANAAVLSRAQEARGQFAVLGVIAIGAETFEPGTLEQFTELAAEEERLLARFEDGASEQSATALRDARATPEVVAGDEQAATMISDATIGGSGEPTISIEDWTTTQTRWIDTIGAVDRELVSGVSAAASDLAFDATKAARLFMISTAIAALLSILLAVWVARSIDRPLRRLTAAANELASEQLPRLVENLRSPDVAQAEAVHLEPIDVTSGDEIGQVTEAFNAIQQVTATVATEQSTLLRKGIGDIFVNLARRNQSLLDRQIEFIDELESKEKDPDLLENLFRLDHLATRMRRNAESLLVLAGAEPARRRAKPVVLGDVLRVAIGEVEDYTRVELREIDQSIVAGNLAVDLSHLLSELMENATHFSPPETVVEIGGAFGPNGDYVLTVADHGIGMSAEQLAEANELLASPPLVGLALGRSLGFIVVGRIAVRLGLRVHLDASPAGGVTAVVSLPPDLVARPGESEPRDPLLDRGPADSLSAIDVPMTAPATTDVPGLTTQMPVAPLGADSVIQPGLVGPEGPPLLARPTVGAEGPPAETAPPPTAELSTDDSDGEGLPSRSSTSGESTAPTDRLSDALPSGADFESGLATLMGAEAVEQDVGHQFWGELADEDDAPSTPTSGEDETPPVPAPPPAPEPAATASPETAPEEAALPPRPRPNGLVRRVPGAAATPSPTFGPAVDAPRRSPEEVRAMLSRYRDGRHGRQEGVSPDDVSTTEERS